MHSLSKLSSKFCFTLLIEIEFQSFSVGVFTVAGIIDSSIYYGQRTIKRKMELGKFT